MIAHPLTGSIAALVRAADDITVVDAVAPELRRRLGLDDDLRRAQALATTWEQTADAARRDAAQARREASAERERAELARTEIQLLDRLAESFQRERDGARAAEQAAYQRETARAGELTAARAALTTMEAAKDRAVADSSERWEKLRSRLADVTGDFDLVSSLCLATAMELSKVRAHGHHRTRTLIAALREARARAIASTSPANTEPHTRDVGGEFIVDNHCPGECGQVESECACDEPVAPVAAAEEVLPAPASPPFVTGFQLLEAARAGRPIPPPPPSPTAIPGPPTSRPDVAPLLAPPPPRPVRAPREIKPARLVALGTALTVRSFDQREKARLDAGFYEAVVDVVAAPAPLRPVKLIGAERDRERNARPREIKAATANVRRLPQRDLKASRVENPGANVRRLPMTRGECAGGVRPCLFVSCRHHLFLDVTNAGNIKLNFPDLEPHQLEHSCALDAADRGGMTLNEVGEATNVTRERVRQIEEKAKQHISKVDRRTLRTLLDEPGAAPPRQLRAPAEDEAEAAE
jgi:hypothetical protein